MNVALSRERGHWSPNLGSPAVFGLIWTDSPQSEGQQPIHWQLLQHITTIKALACLSLLMCIFYRRDTSEEELHGRNSISAALLVFFLVSALE